MEKLTNWAPKPAGMTQINYICGHCNKQVAPSNGWTNAKTSKQGYGYIVLCPNCTRPTFIDGQINTGKYFPSAMAGESVDFLDGEIQTLYDEARRATSVNAYTSCVLACRKILMHVAVNLEADEGESFLYYVEYLFEKHFIPPNSKNWVDYIRKRGNEANHEIELMTKEDAELILSFTGMLLKIIFEFPNKMPVIEEIAEEESEE